MLHTTCSPRTELRIWAVITVVFALWSTILLHLRREAARDSAPNLSEYSWIGDDYPANYPMTVDTVLLTAEDTTHYQLYAADGASEWETQFPPGGGLVQLGPLNRTFDITMFHELRCLGRIRKAVTAQSSGADPDQLQKCFNFLREMALCRADVTLEDVLDAQHSVNHMSTHVCRDWTAVYDQAKHNHERHHW